MGLLLKCEHVGFGYENQDAVLDVNLEVNEGDYICIVGENGSGKSTLMKGILGLLKPTSGRIEYSEELKKAGIGYLPQQTDAQKDFPATVFEVVISGCLGKRGSRPFYSMKEKKGGAGKSGSSGNPRSGKKLFQRAFRRSETACSDRAGALCDG